jgi:antitoxin HigA-1
MLKLKPVTPGELPREEFLVPMGISQYRVAKIKPWAGTAA